MFKPSCLAALIRVCDRLGRFLGILFATPNFIESSVGKQRISEGYCVYGDKLRAEEALGVYSVVSLLMLLIFGVVTICRATCGWSRRAAYAS